MVTINHGNNRSVKNQRVKRTLEDKQKEEDGESDNSDGESEEDFFESSSTSFQPLYIRPGLCLSEG